MLNWLELTVRVPLTRPALSTLCPAIRCIAIDGFAREDIDLAARGNQIGAHIAVQQDISAGHNQFAAHIGIDVNLAAGSEDIALDRRIDVERSPYHHNRIHGCIDAHRAARGEDVVIYRGVDQDGVSRIGAQALPAGCEQEKRQQKKNSSI